MTLPYDVLDCAIPIHYRYFCCYCPNKPTLASCNFISSVRNDNAQLWSLANDNEYANDDRVISLLSMWSIILCIVSDMKSDAGVANENWLDYSTAVELFIKLLNVLVIDTSWFIAVIEVNNRVLLEVEVTNLSRTLSIIDDEIDFFDSCLASILVSMLCAWKVAIVA